MARKIKTAAEIKHEHETPKPCEHELKHCTVCDTVYCVKCGKEWKVQTYSWTTYGTNTWPQTAVYSNDVTHSHDGSGITPTVQ